MRYIVLSLSLLMLSTPDMLILSGKLVAQNITDTQQQLLTNSKPGVYFRENKGQVKDQYGQPRSDVLYSGQTNGFDYHLKKDGLHYQLRYIESRHEPDNERTDFASSNLPVRDFTQTGARSKVVHDEIGIYRVDINWLNTNPEMNLKPGRALPGYENFYNVPEGADPALFVKKFTAVTYKDLYPGIDLHFYENSAGKLEYDFWVQPGTDYRQIEMEIKGAELSVADNNALIIETPFGAIREGALTVYQEGKEIEAYWKVKGNRVCFDIPAHDPSYVLRIDPPVRIWGTYYGGGNLEAGYSCAIDSSGHVFLAGRTQSPTNIATTGAHQDTHGGGISDAFLVKFDPNGMRQWGTYYGGNESDRGFSCTIDDSGHIFLAGATQSTSDIATSGAHQTAHGGGNDDAFLVKFDGNGVRQWGTYYGGNEDDKGYSCTIDDSGHIFLAGGTKSTSDIATSGAHQTAYGGGNYDAFLVKFDGNGVRQWGTYYGGSEEEAGHSCTTDPNGNVFLAGETRSTNAIATSGAHQDTYGGIYDAFLVKFEDNGVRQWGTYYGGSGLDYGYSCDTDGSGNVFLAGDTWSDTAIATPAAHQATYGGNESAFLVKFDGSGIRQWGTYYGGNASPLGTRGQSCATDNNGHVFLAGHTASDTAIATAGAHQDSYGGGSTDAFLAKFDPNGMRHWGTYYGGNDTEWGLACAIYRSRHVFLSGHTQSANAIATAGAHKDTLDSSDAFLVKFDCPATSDTINPMACDSYSSPSGNYIWDTTGTYMDTITNQAGCDSILTINLTLDNSTTSALTPFICDTTYTSPSGNYVWDTTGSYLDTIANTFGCDSILTINLTVTDEIIATAGPDTTLCKGEGVQLTAAGAIAYTWQPDEGLSCTNCPDPTASPSDTTTYMVIVSGGPTCTPDTAYVTVAVNLANDITIEPGDTTIQAGKSIQFNASGGASYTWAPEAGLSCTGCPNPIASPTVTTVYTLFLTDTNGCSTTDSVRVVVVAEAEEEKELFIPNMFSPNEDGINDRLLVYGGVENISYLYLVVTNRWGEKVYETDRKDEAMNTGWDGTHRGQMLNTGVYAYFLRVQYHNGAEVIRQGDITLIR